jgi:hypothetical protein
MVGSLIAQCLLVFWPDRKPLESVVAQPANLRNASLPIGGEYSANQEIDVPRTSVLKDKPPVFGFKKLSEH